MRIRSFSIVVTAFALASPFAARAQQPPVPTAGFNAETLVTELSLFLPGDINLLGGAGRAAGQQAGAAARTGGQQGSGAAQGAPGAAQGAPGAAQGGQRAAGAAANQFRIEKDPKLAFTQDQIAKLIPVFEGLKTNPMPSPTSAKKIQSTVDSVLTKAQKAGIEDARKAREEMIKQFQTRLQQAGAAGGAAGAAAGQGGQFRQGTAAGQGGADAQGGAAGQAGAGAQGARPQQLTPAERRARFVEAFLAALQEAQKGAKK
jgi:hypothetical protein